MIAAGRPRLQRPAGLPLLATVFVAALAEIAVGWSVAASHTELGLYVGAAVALGLCFIFWRQAVYAVFLITFVEGFFRNLLDRPSLLLVKDVVLALIYVRVFGGRLARGLPLIPHSPINRPLAVFSAIVLLQTLNPNVSSMAQGLVGLRAWLYYVPLYYVGLRCSKVSARATVHVVLPWLRRHDLRPGCTSVSPRTGGLRRDGPGVRQEHLRHQRGARRGDDLPAQRDVLVAHPLCPLPGAALFQHRPATDQPGTRSSPPMAGADCADVHHPDPGSALLFVRSCPRWC